MTCVLLGPAMAPVSASLCHGLGAARSLQWRVTQGGTAEPSPGAWAASQNRSQNFNSSSQPRFEAFSQVPPRTSSGRGRLILSVWGLWSLGGPDPLPSGLCEAAHHGGEREARAARKQRETRRGIPTPPSRSPKSDSSTSSPGATSQQGHTLGSKAVTWGLWETLIQSTVVLQSVSSNTALGDSHRHVIKPHTPDRQGVSSTACQNRALWLSFSLAEAALC